MTLKPLPLFTLLGLLPYSLSQAQNEVMPDFEIFSSNFLQTGDMDLDGNPGDLSISNFSSQFILSKPIELFQGISMVPIAAYDFTQLNFIGTGPFPLHDEDLHSLSLSSIFIKNFDNSPWMALGWTRAEMATDFQGISSDDFTFDIAAGLGYKFSDSFMLGFGLVVINLNGDEEIFPGINFNWTPSECFRVSLFGPNLRATYDMNDDWFLTLTAEPGGGVWNIRDDAGLSRSIDFDSYLIGINTHHRISGEFWFNAGVGYTFANEIEIRGNSGSGPSFSREMDGAPFAQIGVSLRTW